MIVWPACSVGNSSVKSTVWFARLPRSRPVSGPVSLESSICPKSGALMTAGSRRLPSDSQRAGRIVVAAINGLKGKTSAKWSTSFFPPTNCMVSLPCAARIAQSMFVPEAAKRNRTSSAPCFSPSPVRLDDELAERCFSNTPARNRLHFPRSPPSVSQLNSGNVARWQSASTAHNRLTRGGCAPECNDSRRARRLGLPRRVLCNSPQ